jgi:hypothetical protein
VNRPLRIIVVSLSIALFGGAHPAVSVEKPKADRAIFQAKILPIFEANCMDCHGDDAPSYATYLTAPERFKKEKLGPRMMSYDEVMLFVTGPEFGSMARRLDDGANTPNQRRGNMFKYLGETDRQREENLRILKQWIGEKSWRQSAAQAKPNH